MIGPSYSKSIARNIILPSFRYYNKSYKLDICNNIMMFCANLEHFYFKEILMILYVALNYFTLLAFAFSLLLFSNSLK